MKPRLNKPQNILEEALDLATCDLMDIHKEVHNKWCENCGIKNKCDVCVITSTCECCLVTWPCATSVIFEGVFNVYRVLTTDDFS
jgi:hypothetical protein